ncbi:uncharacterized protein LOC142362089 isoform X3 [Opisthocomus hoazin]|uniref:uncharacterized protein LOC142362089 isoform X3 n=1 Tax=Opisthocomus hoazin TaxID=30419 RepID=UPI003F52C990
MTKRNLVAAGASQLADLFSCRGWIQTLGPLKANTLESEAVCLGSLVSLELRDMRVFSWLEDRQVTGLTEKEGEKEREASEAAVSPGNAESESCGGEEPNDWSYRRRREERRREKHLKCQSLLAAPRARAAWPAPCSSFLAATVQQRIIPGAD